VERARSTPSGARSGVLIGAASLLATLFNYVFLLAAGRVLGSDDYGALAALLGLLTVVLLPIGALQLAVSREVSRRRAEGDVAGAESFARTTLTYGLVVTAPVVVLGLALVVPLREFLSIGSTAAPTFAVLGLTIAIALPIATGVLQGYERFRAVALLYVFPFALRLALLAASSAAGYRLGGAVFAAVAAGIVTMLLAVAFIREPLRRGTRTAWTELRPFLRYLWPVVVGLTGIAILTNVDLLVVRARFTDDAGAYAAASAFARIAFFLPATILTVLFPRTAARQARGEDTADILGRSLLVTAAFGGGLAIFYWMTGRGLIHTSFGAEFASGGDLVVALTISMTLFALANVLVGFHLSRGETRYAWIVAAAVPVQIAVLAVVPDSASAVIAADIAVGVALLVAHELLVGTSGGAIRAGTRLLTGGIRIPRQALAEAACVLLGLAVFVGVLFWPVTVRLGSAIVADGSDAVGGVWWLWRMQHEGGYHLFGTTHHLLTGAPFGWDEANGLNLQWLLPYYPAYLATKVIGEVAAFNLVLLSGYVLSGAAMYALTRYLGCGRLVSAWAALVFVVFPWHLARTPHPSLVHLELLPLLLVTLVATARSPTLPRFGLVGAATLGCWLTSGYFGTMAVVVSLVFGLSLVTVVGVRRGLRLTGGATGAAIAASVLVATLAVIAGTGQDVGVDRVSADLSQYGLRAVELIVPPHGNHVLGGALDSFWASRYHGSNPTETRNYLGLLTIVLALGWVVVAWRRRAALSLQLRAATVGFAAVVVAGLVLAAPSPLSLFGHDVWAPSRVLWEVTPAFRVPTRWIPVVMAALVPLAALGLQALVRRASGWRPGALVPVLVVAAATCVSFLELSIGATTPLLRTNLPEEYEALGRTPDGIAAEYPLVQDVDRLFWQRVHGRPLLNSEAIGKTPFEAARMLVDPGAPGTAEALSFLGVTAIVTHPDALDFVSDQPDVPNADWGPGYELVARTPGGSSVWRVVAPAAPALVLLAGGFSGPVPLEGGGVGYPFVSPAGVGTMELIAKAPSVATISFVATPPGGQKRVLRIADTASEASYPLDGPTPISLRVEVPRGRSYLVVKTDPAATSEDDAIVLSAPRATSSTDEPEFRAEPIEAEPGL
jgi:O-antigen/teichoic acid export membrane protein